MLKKKKSKTFAKLISLAFLILSCVLTYFLVSLKVLPNKYFIPIIVGLVIINIVLFVVLCFSNKLSIKLVAILGCIGLGYGVYSLANTKELLKSMNINYKTSNYVVIVNKDSDYQKLNDLSGKSIGYLNDDKGVLKKVRIKFDAEEYEDVSKLIEELFKDDVSAIILENSYVDMLNEEGSPISGFKDKIRIIYDLKFNTEVKDISKDVNTEKESFIIYFSGIDTYGNVSSVSRTDANMLGVFNPKTKQILLISIPRDYYIELYGKNGKDKLTHSGIYGIDNTIKSVEKLLDIDINYYYKINFTSLINIVDSVGGVDVLSSYTFVSNDGYKYTKGYNHVNGKEALSFVRERKSFSAGDRVRNIHQQAMVEALFRKCTQKSIIVKYNSLLSSLKNSFITNMPSSSLVSLIKQQLSDDAKWTITSYSLNGTNSREYTYSYKSNKLYVMMPDTNTITKAKELIRDVFDGKKLEATYDGNVSKINTVTKSEEKKVTSNSTSNVVSNSNVSKEYTVKYIIDGSDTSIKVKPGEIIKAKSIPGKDGYEVLGWYLNDVEFNFNNPINSDLELVAKYKEILEEKEPEEQETIKEDINQ